MIYFLLILLAVLLLAAFAIKTSKESDGGKGENWPLVVKRPLSQPEQVLYYRLIEALPGFVILPQVSLSRFLDVKKGVKNPMSWLNRVNRMSVDYLVCSPAMQIVAVIELDDASHKRPNRIKADETKKRVLTTAGIHIIRWHVQSLPKVSAIEARLQLAPEMPLASVN
ncbi:DUF2726 domain-containing protein [Chitinimonas sp. BJB300]|uniref:DUF2726 domain-containing protein n=1 Tax=Chitinimonas sp. BJB300 TaxID=1559339 RepID=UPI000C0E72D5|nr:DUF2726 domain-containing protein [Chitinimonas sp. BJB300]PHV12455.1 hypothetical protein CSQ89_05725 [Chitinimonas sp. BJB300]TSJ88579.1 DUF2726 domain-containing protein [Chitinimonas sp. BJB300]